jgi:hypothetical protein
MQENKETSGKMQENKETFFQQVRLLKVVWLFKKKK